jgi:hypothetical protein
MQRRSTRVIIRPISLVDLLFSITPHLNRTLFLIVSMSKAPTPITIDNFPPVPQALIQALDKLYPERSPSKGDTYDALMWRGGERSVVRFLLAAFNKQNES